MAVQIRLVGILFEVLKLFVMDLVHDMIVDIVSLKILLKLLMFQLLIFDDRHSIILCNQYFKSMYIYKFY